jgi:hypothetical protein
VEVVKIAEGMSREEMVVDVPQCAVNAMQEKDHNTLIVKKVDLVVFINDSLLKLIQNQRS